MISKPILYKLFTALMVITLLSACSTPTPAPTATPTVPPATATLSPTAISAATSTPAATDTLAPTLDQTQAAQTIAANATLTAPTLAPATATPASTATLARTVTPIPTALPPTPTLYPYTLAPTNTPSGYACMVSSTSPKSTDSVKVSTDFDWSWVIVNTGIKTWGQHNADLKYISGQAMQTGGSLYNLTADVASSQSYTATIHMHSPATAGTFTAVWQIVQDSVLVCALNVSVRVVN